MWRVTDNSPPLPIPKPKLELHRASTAVKRALGAARANTYNGRQALQVPQFQLNFL